MYLAMGAMKQQRRVITVQLTMSLQETDRLVWFVPLDTIVLKGTTPASFAMCRATAVMDQRQHARTAQWTMSTQTPQPV